jgi:hypothetical protein
MDIKKWTAIGAASVLGIGIFSGGAIATANAIQLNGQAGVDTGIGQVATDVPRFVGSPATPSAVSATSAVSANSAADPTSAVSAQSPASADSPMSAPSAVSPASADSPASPGSAD